MPRKQNGAISSLFVLVLLLLLGLGCGFDLSCLFPERTWDRSPPATEGRVIFQNYSDNVIWRRDHVLIRRLLLPSPGLLAGHGYVAFVNFLGGPLSQINRLDVLDGETGDTLWQSKRFSHHEAIAISEDKAFVLLSEGSPLNVYNIKHGDEAQASFNYFQETTQFYMFPPVAEDEIYIYYQQGDEYSLHSINLEGNEVGTSRRIQVSGRHPPLFLFDEPFILKIGEDHQYIGADFETGEELWCIPALGAIDSWPVLQGDTLVISAGDGVKYLLVAVDTQTGHKLWETEKIFGPSVILHQDSLYALRDDAVLVKLDFTAGRIQEEIPFEPASINPGKWAYLLASDGERLFVYFGDSQELFALKIP